MSLYVIHGIMRSGKSYIAVNKEVRGFLVDSRRDVYTNLPINLEEFACSLGLSSARRIEAMGRLHLLRPGQADVEVPEYDEDSGEVVMFDRVRVVDGVQVVERVPKVKVHRCDRIKEFWWFVKPGSVVMLDETADIFSSDDYKQSTGDKRKVLGSMINHHGHYKLDLYFICQDKEDLDIKVRSKIMFVYEVTNMKYEPILPGVPWLRGLRWPVQFFRVRVLQGKHVLGKRGAMDRFEPMDAYTVFPTQRGYRNYRSFSAAHSTLAGMKSLNPDDPSIVSSDVETGAARIKKFVAGSGPIIGVGLAFCVGVLVVCRLFWWAGNGFHGAWYNPWAVEKTVQKIGVSESVAVGAKVKATNQPVSVVGTNVLKIKLTTSDEIKLSDGRVFRVGDETGFGRLSAIAVNGCVVGTNEYRFKDFLFLCRRGGGA